MLKAKISVISMALTAALTFSACNTISDYYQYFTGDIDTSLREPTGYYEHETVADAPDQLVVPNNLQAPPSDKTLVVPPATVQTGLTGEGMDIRAPIVPLRSSIGIDAQWINGEAIVWLQPFGSHGIHTEDDAWKLLGNVLNSMHVKVGQVTEGAYELTTMSADFNEYGAPYTGRDSEAGALRYTQIYRIRIGRAPNGAIGIATSLIGSMTALSSGKAMENTLSGIELQRFAMGFANSIIDTLDRVNAIESTIPDTIAITLDRDSNKQDCFIVEAPYDITWNVVRDMLPKYNFEVLEYSISASTIKVEFDEPDADFYMARGLDSFGLESDDYIIRVAIEGDKTVLTFYDEDDKPLPTEVVTRLYPGFSKALMKAFDDYKTNGIQSFI